MALRSSASSDSSGAEYQDDNIKSLYALYRPKSYPERKKMSKLGIEIPVTVNAYQVRCNNLLAGKLEVYRYDVKFESMSHVPLDDGIPRPVKERIWLTNKMQQALNGPSHEGAKWLYDNNNLAWSLESRPSFEVVVDLNLADGRGESRPGSKNIFQVYINKIEGSVKFSELAAVLRGESHGGKPGEPPAAWQQATTVLDHVIHQGPRNTHMIVKKSFFKKGQRAEDLGGGIKVLRGIFGSMKIAGMGISSNPPKLMRSPVINIDATTCCLWEHGPLLSVIKTALGLPNDQVFSNEFRKVAKGNEKGWANTRLGQQLQRLKGIRVTHNHRQLKKGEKPRVWSIKGFIPMPPLAMKFIIEDKGEKNDPLLPPGEVTITDYFAIKYGKDKDTFKILPCVDCGKGGIVPIEVCDVVPEQRYTYKLDPRQTSSMLRIAAQPPNQRRQHIENGFKGLGWDQDKWMNEFGIEVRNQMIQVNARLLETPDIVFKKGRIAGSKAKEGKWRIQGFQFITPNKKPIKSWAIAALNDGRGACVSLPALKNFGQQLQNKFSEHGGIWGGRPMPAFLTLDTRDLGSEIRKWVETQAKPKIGGPPDLFVVVVPDKSSDHYNQIKKVSDCLFGMASQVCQASHVEKCAPEYLSNVCMKINAKLGGATSQVKPHKILEKSPFYSEPGILIVGADVTHGAPGSHAPSVACLVMSQDSKFTRYSGMVEVNGQRKDIIQTFQMEKMFNIQLNDWMNNNGGKGPTRVLYFRDGVSREQCREVIEQEVRDMKNCLIKLMEEQKDGVARAKAIKFTAIVCTKRHHVRIFPKNGDRNGNSLPGTLVETGVTDGIALDWYLNSHVALKGTARPMHYNVILDENDFDMEQLQQFIFEHSFQYARSTTPVSQHPAIYYAHLCSRRGACHEDKAITTSSQKMIDQLQLEGLSVEQAVKMVKEQKDREAADDYKLDRTMLPVWKDLAHYMWFI